MASRRVYSRESLEFERVAFFSDAIFAIALTLLVVALDPPQLADDVNSRQLWDALNDMSSEILMFFISFAVLGSFWLAHHRFVGALKELDRRTTVANLVYLGLIAFLPFPSAVLGEYGDNAVAVGFFATFIAAISIASWLLNETAIRHDLMVRPPPPVVVRWNRITYLVNAGYFLASILLAAFVAPSVALWSWILLFPINAALGRRAPAVVNEYNDG